MPIVRAGHMIREHVRDGARLLRQFRVPLRLFGIVPFADRVEVVAGGQFGGHLEPRQRIAPSIAGTTLSALGLFGDVRDTAWLASAPTAFVVIWLLVVWQAVPYIAITTYAAQSQLDPSFAEAAALDGAGRLRTYWQVTVPLLAPHLGTICILSCIWDFNIFNQIWLLTQGGPDSQTATIGVYTYRQAFVGFRIGEGSAISVVTMVILFVLTLAYLRRLASEHDR